MAAEIKPNIWDELRKPFPPGSVGKLPKPTISNDEWKKLPKATCNVCQGYHATSRTIHLDYLGHAAVTDRLNNVDPTWTWEPLAFDAQGTPALDREGNLWIRLSINGVTRLGVGDGKNMKERIGDALRNAAMRFGVGLDLWSKDELESHVENPDLKNDKPQSQDDFPPEEPSRQVTDEPISNLSKQRVRQAFGIAGMAGSKVTEYCEFIINKPAPTTEADATALLTSLEQK